MSSMQLEFLLSTCFWLHAQLKVHCSLQGSTVTDSCRHEPCELHSAAPCSGSFFNTQSVPAAAPHHARYRALGPRVHPTTPVSRQQTLPARARSRAMRSSGQDSRGGQCPSCVERAGGYHPPLSAAEVYRAHKRHRPHRSSHETQSRHDTEDGASQPTHAHAT